MFGRAPQDDVDLRHLTERVDRLEALVAQLQWQLQSRPQAAPEGGAPSVPPAEPAYLAEVRELKARGKKINAIKVYREHTSASLRDAKDFVERMP